MINQTETKNYKAICDTIRIKLNLNDFKIIEDKFDSPVNKVLSYYGRGIATAYQGMTAEDKRLNHYKPKLLLINGMQHGGRNVYLQIDVSIPKLLYGNNLQEVCDQDFKQSVLKLQKVLIEMGISASPKILANAPIVRFHSCKNIILPRGLATQMVVSNVSKIYFGARSSSGHTDYLNGGHCARFHYNEYEIAVYDKIADIQQMRFSPKRCVDDEAHRSFQNIDINKLGNLQVLRLEVRLNTSKVIRQKLTEVGITFDEGHIITLRDVFSSEISRRLNAHYWKKICEAGRSIYALNDNSENIMANLGNMKLKKKIEFLGMLKLIDDCGASYARKLIGKNVTSLKLFNIVRNYSPDDRTLIKIFGDIGRSIVKDEVIVLPTEENYQQKTLEEKETARDLPQNVLENSQTEFNIKD